MTNGGRVSLLGTHAVPATIDLSQEIIFKGIRIYGITGRRLWDTWYRTTALLEEGPRHLADHHPPAAARPTTPPRSTWSRPVMPARSCCCRRRVSMKTAGNATTRIDPLAYLDAELEDLRAKNLYRPLRSDDRHARRRTRRSTGRPVISLSSNNYLGLATHPHLVEAALNAVRDLGVGLRRRAHHRRHDGAAPRSLSAGWRSSSTSKRCSPSKSGFDREQRRHPDDHGRA